MVWVKVCGLSRMSDLKVAIDAGADAFGMVLAAGTPRYITAKQAGRLAAASSIPGILVTVDETPTRLMKLVDEVGAQGVQPHGQHRVEACEEATRRGLFVLRPIKVGAGPVTVDKVPSGQVPILDTADANRHGGTGRTFDYSRVPAMKRKWVLAGGLGSHNVAEAIKALQPWGVDASSHLESSLGVKDPARIRAFIREAKK